MSLLEGTKWIHGNVPAGRPRNIRKTAYKPFTLLNFTVKHFRDTELSSLQLESRAGFVKAFKDCKNAYENVSDYMQLQRFQADIRSFIIGLDGFFFFGYLDRRLRLTFETIDASPSNEEPSNATNNDNDTIQIRIRLGESSNLNGIEGVVASILHVMVHAYHLCFCCKCDNCKKEMLNTTGHPCDQHGPVFLILHRLIVTEMRRWDPVLEGFLEHDCPQDKVSQSAKDSSRKFVASLDEVEKMKYSRSPYRVFASRSFGLAEDDTVIVQPPRRPPNKPSLRNATGKQEEQDTDTEFGKHLLKHDDTGDEKSDDMQPIKKKHKTSHRKQDGE
ncbi:hypothetical protein F4777DRAFT_578251 [Nemania sp. FL0916]|nr:hypothetical protein F4777DRAFT_578251 [Nemania sp. FL0916]